MDSQLARLARAERSHYTRYADDLCFSTDRTVFPSSLGMIEAGRPQVGQALREVIADGGFRINEGKTRLMRRTQRQRVTGLVVNEKTNVPRVYVRKLRDLLFIWKTHGEEAAKESFARQRPHLNWPPEKAPAAFRQVVRGRVQYVGGVKGWDDPVYVRLADALTELDDGFAARVLSDLPETSVRLYTEGPSDIMHMLAASQYFETRGEYLWLRLVLDDKYTPTNDAGLLTHLRGMALSRQANPCVFLFDNDSDLVRKAVPKEDDWRSWGNGVVAVRLVNPPWRAASSRICIEMLHEDVVLQKRNSEGRRLFLSSEFDSRTGFHNSASYMTPHPGGKTLVREDVYETQTQKPVALAKTAFASAVASGESPYEGVDFEGFRPTFQAIADGVRTARQELASRDPPA